MLGKVRKWEVVGVKYEDLVNHAKEFGFDPESHGETLKGFM